MVPNGPLHTAKMIPDRFENFHFSSKNHVFSYYLGTRALPSMIMSEAWISEFTKDARRPRSGCSPLERGKYEKSHLEKLELDRIPQV